MRVTALDEGQVLLAIKQIEVRGHTLRAVATYFGVQRYTIRRAIRLYQAEGSSVFDHEKCPQRGVRKERRKKPRANDVDRFSALSKKW